MSLDSDLDRTKTRWIWEEVQACVLDPGGVSLQFQRLGPVSYKAE